MKRMLALGVVALLCSPMLVKAQAYKCKQPDGSLAFQDRPCSGNAAGSKVDLPPVQGYSPGSVGDPGSFESAAPQRVGQRNNEVDAANARVEAENRQVRCNAARQRLGVLKEERPVYQRDNAGNRVYIEDKDRPAAIAQAEKDVANFCQ